MAHSDFDVALNLEATTAQGLDQGSEGDCTPGRNPPDGLSDLEISVFGGVHPKVGTRRGRGTASVVIAARRRLSTFHVFLRNRPRSGGRLPALVD